MEPDKSQAETRQARNEELLALELQEIQASDFDLSLTGF
jgi:hypothetical protein